MCMKKEEPRAFPTSLAAVCFGEIGPWLSRRETLRQSHPELNSRLVREKDSGGVGPEEQRVGCVPSPSRPQQPPSHHVPSIMRWPVPSPHMERSQRRPTSVRRRALKQPANAERAEIIS